MKADVFDLIKSLTPGEKKAVRFHAFAYKKDGGNVLQKLFTLLDKQPTYDESVLKKKIPNLSNRKKELWYKIMLILQLTEEDLDAVNGRRKLDFVHILLKKRLFKQAYHMNQTAMNWCEENEQVVYKALVLGYFTSMAQYIKPGNVAQTMKTLQKEILENGERINVNMKAFDFYSTVYEAEIQNEIMRTTELQMKARELLKLPNAQLPIDKMSLHIKSYFLDAHSRVHGILRDYVSSKRIQEMILGHFVNHKIRNMVEAGVYYDGLLTIMYDCCMLGDYSSWANYLKEYKRIHDKYFIKDAGGLGYYHIQRLCYCYKANESLAKDFIKEAEEYLQSHDTKPEEVIRQLEKELCVISFVSGDFDKAWHYNTRFMQKIAKDLFEDRQEFMRTFFLFILLEKSDYYYLAVKIKQYAKFLSKKNKNLYAFDLLVLHFVRNMRSSMNNRLEQKKAFKEFAKGITNLLKSNDLYTSEILRVFDFRKWVDQKLSQQLPI